MNARDLDPIRLSRELDRANETRLAWERRSREQPDPEDAPLQAHRALLSHERFAAVAALPDADPLKESLLRWSWLLLERRVNQAWYARAAHLYYGREHAVDEPSKGSFSAAAMLRGALGDEARRGAWLSALPGALAEPSRVLGVLWQRKSELARRLRVDIDAIVLPAPEVIELAQAWLRDSADLAREFPVRNPADLLRQSLASDLHAGFPARINETLLASWFREGHLLRDLEPRGVRLPEPFGLASFARALVSFGRAFRVAAASTRQPFVIAHDPYDLEAWTSGFVFAGLLDSPAFLKRRLELSAAGVANARRGLARVELFASRLFAFAVARRPLALTSYERLRNEFSEQAHAAFGCELAADLALTLPRCSDDDAQRFAGWALAYGSLARLEEEHDEDWFRNPRAIDQLRSEAQLSPSTRATADDLRVGSARALARLSARLGG